MAVAAVVAVARVPMAQVVLVAEAMQQTLLLLVLQTQVVVEVLVALETLALLAVRAL